MRKQIKADSKKLLGNTWQPPIKVLIVNYLKKHKRSKRADLYLAIKNHSERTIRITVRDLVKEGTITEDPCECGFTAFLELV